MATADPAYNPALNNVAIATVGADPRVAGLAGTLGTIVSDGTSSYMKIGAANADWRKLNVEKSSVTGAAVTDVTFSSLNGDLDGGYLIEGFVFSSAGNALFSLQPNALTTNQKTIRFNNDGTTGTPSSVTDLRLANGTTNRYSSFVARFASRTGRNRALHVQTMTGVATANVADIYEGHWDETATATNITSLVIHSSIASGIGIGSLFTLTYLGNPLM